MKTVLRGAIGLTLLLGASALFGQQPYPPPTGAPAPAAPAPAARAAFPGGIALLDVSVIFDKHNRFQGQMEAMKAEVKQFEEYLRSKQAAIQAEAEKAKQFQPGSPQYKQIEETVVRMQNDLKIETGFKRKEFLEREAEAYYAVYREVESVVASYSQRYGVSLVLRYGSQEINPKDRESVLRGINRPVVFRQNYLDITEPILAQLNLGTRPVVPSGGAPTGLPQPGVPAGPGVTPGFPPAVGGPPGGNPNSTSRAPAPGGVFVPGTRP